jgi:hypothetical protein
MSLSLLGWLFSFGVVVHNMEEAWFLPAWSKRPRFRHTEVSAGSFRFAALALSLAALLAAWLASAGGVCSFGAYFITGYALTMVLNALVPHIAACIVLRSYAPGTATALLFNLPLGGWLVHRALAERYVEPSVFVISAPITILCIIASIPLLLAVGSKLFSPASGEPMNAGHIKRLR